VVEANKTFCAARFLEKPLKNLKKNGVNLCSYTISGYFSRGDKNFLFALFIFYSCIFKILEISLEEIKKIFSAIDFYRYLIQEKYKKTNFFQYTVASNN
jgi:hypothetical protein